jgi:hypothetical protein
MLLATNTTPIVMGRTRDTSAAAADGLVVAQPAIFRRYSLGLAGTCRADQLIESRTLRAKARANLWVKAASRGFFFFFGNNKLPELGTRALILAR